MNTETRVCQNCKQNFTIESEDFDFYKKIDVPPPTWCPDCRFLRRVSFRNERNLYKKSCDFCNKNIIAMYHSDTSFPVYCRDCWYSDAWDPQKFALEYNKNENFFSQFEALMKKVPRPALIASNNINSPYVNYSIDLKDSYFMIGCSEDENCVHAYRTFNSKDSTDCFGVVDSEHIHEGLQVVKSSKVFFSRDTENSLDSSFLMNCRNLSNCFACANLQNKKYSIFNQEYSKEEYEKKKNEYSFDSWNGIKKLKRDTEEFFLKFPRRFARIILSKDSTGNDLAETKNCRNCYVIRESENVKHGAFGTHLKESYDLNFADNAELVYESTNIEQNYAEHFSITSWFSRYVTYCDLCFSSSNLFGCIGLRNKEYCILNKQYTKEEYEILKKTIIQNMNKIPYIDKGGRIYTYGEFFPQEISPFAYNDSIAFEYAPITKEDAEKRGYKWKECEKKEYQVTLFSENIPDNISDIRDSILEEIIECEHKNVCGERCTGAFRIIPQELQFYKQMKLPIPRLCPNCRHQARLKKRNPLKLWHRKCMKPGCTNEFETSYAPDRKEIIYCEQCYQAEVV